MVKLCAPNAGALVQSQVKEYIPLATTKSLHAETKDLHAATKTQCRQISK